MKKLDWYIARKFLGTLFFVLGLTALLSLVFDYSEKVEDFSNTIATKHQIVFDYYLNFVPTIINLMSPLIIFISALYFTSRMANNSEIVAMLSAGISYRRILRPYIIVAVFLSLTDLGMKNFIFPIAYNSVTNFEQAYLIKGYQYQGTNIHRRLSKDEYFYCYIAKYPENKVVLFSYERFKGKNLVYKLWADEAIYDRAKKNWHLVHFKLREINGMLEKIASGDSMDIKMPITIDEFGQKVRSIPSMTTPELIKVINTEKMKGEDITSFYEVEKWKRFAMPADIIILVLIAVSIASRKIRGGLGAHLLLGIVIGVSHEMFVRVSTTFATSGDFPPALSVWLPAIVYGSIAILLLRRAQK